MQINGKRLEIEFASEEDVHYFLKFWRKCRAESGTVTGLYAGLGCSALRTADIYDPETGAPVPAES